MAVLRINGGKRLYGETVVQGAKNSALPCLAAAALGRECIVHNCPDLTDTKAGLKILNALGVETEFKNNTVITKAPQCLSCSKINDGLMKEMRSSVMFLGAILSKCGEAEISYPGGCSIGARPIDLHLKAFSQMGVNIKEDGERIFCKVEKLKDAKIKLAFPSVGATENIMLLGVVSDCEFEIENPAREPEILDLRNFLNSMGGNISEGKNGNLLIKGVKALGNTEYKIIPDRIVALTYLSGIALCGGYGIIKNVRPDHIKLPLKILEAAGNDIKCGEDYIEIKAPRQMRGFGIINTMPYPDFPTDAQAIFMAASLLSRGESCFIENIFENRFGHTLEFLKMGANIRICDNSALVSGVKRLKGAELYAKDLRGGAALVIGALSAKGESIIHNTEFIDRGYENIERSFSDFGGEIVREG